ncbi:inositol 5-phosphatase 1, putative [Bodo saltans]|uniref:Inositol 5-phosphatase 1, putative n=1 Tax=Bodo saltans TaxID=75058 RepID=A0A0S4KQ91_BODSA|nr:inositol 5-phosphatase 1, putative [Bodo saltans]|eukprot:CUI15100.1 inositol 5-phosphatase 1, putative [Bodo saltans]
MSRHFDASSPSSSSPTTAGKQQPTPSSASSQQQQLEGNTLFEHLGEPMKRLLLQVHRDISDNDLTMYSKISVRQMAKVFDMLSLEEDPDKILAWLHREASRDQQQGNRRDPGATGGRRGDGIRQSTVAADPIKLYRELEQKHVLLMEKFRQDQMDRDHARSLNAAERKQRREAQGLIPTSNDNQENIAAATSSSVAGTISDVLSKTELADVVGSFERFTAQQSTYDNSSSHQDNEWWKKDEYRRNWEKFGTKGKLWTRVLEGGSQEAPESERLVRDEWYKSQTWWKGDTYRRDWNASRGTEWWKEEPYLVDWQDHGDKGSMWMANDEATGFKKKGHRRPASNVERARRVAWYQINGPRGIVKMWCACSEGSADRCTLEEKRERSGGKRNHTWSIGKITATKDLCGWRTMRRRDSKRKVTEDLRRMWSEHVE